MELPPDAKPGIRPRQTIWRALDVTARAAFPVTTAAFGLFALSLPLGLPGQAQLQPAWAMTAVFFWSLYRPAAMPAGYAFALGLMLDLLAQGPVGIWALLLLLIHAMVLRLRRTATRQGFATVWALFTLTAITAALTEWALVSLLTWHALPPWPALFEAGVASGAYPTLAIALITAHRGIAAPERA
jgi:rod shape-determining protein MreD